MEIQERIRKFDTDYFGFCRASAMVNLGMDALMKEVEQEGYDRETMLEKHGAVWMAAHYKYELERPLFADETVELLCGKLRCSAAHALSEMQLLVKGQPVGRAFCAWILVDQAARKILHPGEIPGLDKAEAAPKGQFRRGILPPETAGCYSRLVRYSDCDVNGHFNSPRYADCICDAHGLERFAPCYVSEMQISFSAESKPGDLLEVRTWQADGLYMAHAACNKKARFSACFACRPHEKVQ